MYTLLKKIDCGANMKAEFPGEGNKRQVIIRSEYLQSNDKLLEECQMEDKKGKQERTKHEVEEIVEFIRLDLYNRGVPCGAQVIQQQMEELNIKPMPSVRTIGRILARYGLTHGRTGIYPEDLLKEYH
jgi:coenzyme F420-reducing hydrogenase gamma subunit